MLPLRKITSAALSQLSNHPHSSQRHFIKHLGCTTRNQPLTLTAASSFLQTTCHLSADAALAVAHKIKLKTTVKAQSVVQLLKQFSFSDADIAALVVRSPRVLSCSVEKSIKPKLEFYRTIGLPPKCAAYFPVLLLSSLRNKVVPNFQLLKSIMPNDEELMKMLRRLPSVLIAANIRENVIPRINRLVEHGVPRRVITILLVFHVESLFPSSSSFEEAYEEVKRMGICPSSSVFARALGLLARVSKSLRQKKLDNLKDIGWSQDQMDFAFARFPILMTLSDKKVRKNAGFFEEKLGWGAELLSVYPAFLGYSLEGRLIPRYAAWRILVSKGLHEDKTPKPSFFVISKERFAEKYVTKYKDEVPELIDVLKGNEKKKKI